jgi:hypothetical protein
MLLFTITPFIGPALGPLIGWFINQYTNVSNLSAHFISLFRVTLEFCDIQIYSRKLQNILDQALLTPRSGKFNGVQFAVSADTFLGRWSFYVLLIWTGVIFICFLFIAETYHPVLLHPKVAALRQSTNNSEYHSASELDRTSKSLSRSLINSLYRPFRNAVS